jgi:hypothetical protein
MRSHSLEASSLPAKTRSPDAYVFVHGLFGPFDDEATFGNSRGRRRPRTFTAMARSARRR